MKIPGKSRSLLAVAMLILILLVIVLSQLDRQSSVSGNRKKISLIVYGDDNERWENLRQGADLVCEEKDADLALITMLSQDDALEQEEIIAREINNGADALIIAACDSKEIKAYMDTVKVKIPVVYVESLEVSAMDTIDTVVVTPDDYRMGYELGEALIENESDIVTVAIISENTKRDSVRLREKGFRDAIEGKVGKIIDWNGNDRKKNVRTQVFIQKALVSEATDVIVSFDNPTTDALLDALANLNQSSRLYSISTSNQAVYSLYSNEIKALEYPNEFSMGYLAAMYVFDRSYAGRKYSGEEIEYRLVRKENMYDEDNQRLLFPFVN